MLNHLIAAEPAARARLMRHVGRELRVTLRVAGLRPWAGGREQGVERRWSFAVTPAGLLEATGDSSAAPVGDRLEVRLDVDRPWQTLRQLAAGERPGVRIEGDAGFATDIGWLIDHLRWDAEEDLSRLIGDAAAHALVSGAGRVVGWARAMLMPGGAASRARPR